MLPEDSLDRLLDDLEAQAEGLYLAERAAEVTELSVAQYAEVSLADRWQASVDRPIRVVMTDGWDLRGQLVRAGTNWIAVDVGGGRGWALHLRFVATVTGLADRTVPRDVWPLSARLSLGSVLRRLAEEPGPVGLRLVDGRVVHGTLTRVGADFVGFVPEVGEAAVVPLSAVVAAQLRVDAD
jgi:small nuclear ribonucleoprotein (snRNP)-like protein